MRTTHVLSTLLITALSSYAMAKGTTQTPDAALALTTINGVPLKVNVGDDMSFQVFNTTIDGGATGQIYPSTQTTLADMGWMVRVGSTLYAPSFSAHGSTATSGLGTLVPYGAPTASSVSGSGTTAAPFTVTTTGTLGATLSSSQRVTYVNGENFFRKAFTLTNSAAAPVSVRVFLGSDIFLASSDSGKPFREPQSGAPGGQNCAGVTPTYTILHISQGTPAAASFSATGFSSIWSQIGAGALNNTVNTAACIDNGAALGWDVAIPAGGSTTFSAATSFGAIPGVIVGPPPVVAPIVPVPTLGNISLMLLVTGLLGFGVVLVGRRQA